MRLKNIIVLFLIVLTQAYGFSQDYVHPTKEIDKVEIIANTAVVLRTHQEPNLLISSSNNRRKKKNTSGLQPTFSKDNTGFNVFVEQDDRRLKVESFQTRLEEPLVIYLPERMKLSVESRSHNDIRISGFINEIEAKADHGDIRIADVTGPLILENSHGDIFVVFKEVSQHSPMSFINSIGDIDLSIPSNANADIELSIRGGELFTDHSLVPVEVPKKEEEKTRTSNFINAKLNKGGVSITIMTSRGDVLLRKQ